MSSMKDRQIMLADKGFEKFSWHPWWSPEGPPNVSSTQEDARETHWGSKQLSDAVKVGSGSGPCPLPGPLAFAPALPGFPVEV